MAAIADAIKIVNEYDNATRDLVDACMTQGAASEAAQQLYMRRRTLRDEILSLMWAGMESMEDR